MKRVLVTGAGGFIAHHLVRRLKADGCWVRGVDVKRPEFCESYADEFFLLDLKEFSNCRAAFAPVVFDEAYHLAADMGGMGFISTAACDIMRHNALMDIHMVQAAKEAKVPRYFFSSSACIYRDMNSDEPEMSEEQAYPALPDNEYGWEKLYAERIALAYGKQYGFNVRIARFQNCYGPEGTWSGGREKAPAAICRKVAQAEDGGTIDIWGDGSAIRSYTYVEDMIDAICRLMQSGLAEPVNVANPEYISVRQLVEIIARVAGKKIHVRSVDGPVGVQCRNFSNSKIYSIGWRPHFNTEAGICKTYPWIAQQVQHALKTA